MQRAENEILIFKRGKEANPVKRHLTVPRLSMNENEVVEAREVLKDATIAPNGMTNKSSFTPSVPPSSVAYLFLVELHVRFLIFLRSYDLQCGTL